MADLRQIITKYASILKEDKFEEFFARLNSSEISEVADFIYNKAVVNFIPFIKTVKTGMFSDFTDSDITLGNNIKAIEAGSFTNSAVVRVDLSKADVTSLPKNLFADCVNLKIVLLPEKLTAIPEGLFEGCEELEKVKVPASVIDIRPGAFNRVNDSVKIFLENKNISIGRADEDFIRTHAKMLKKKGE